MRVKHLFALALSFGAPSVHADQGEIFLSEHAAQFGYARPIGVSAGDLSAAVFFNRDSDLMANGGLVISGQPPGQLPFSVAAGAKVYAFHLDNADENVLAGALGGRISYTIPANIPFVASAETFYAPAITTTGVADDMLDFALRFEVEFLPRTSGFIGYRWLNVGLGRRDDAELDNNIHIGLRLNF
jgi:hypothetical protein